MVSKKIVINFILCSAISSCFGMEALEKGVKAVKDSVGSLYSTARDKADPLLVFKEIENKWNTSTDRKKVTLSHKLDRGFLDGHLQKEDLPKLLDEVEASITLYPVCPITIEKIYTHLEKQIPAIRKKESLLKRVITTMYLLKPSSLADRITNNLFINNVPDDTDRENIIGTTMKQLADKQDSNGIIALVGAIQKNEQVALGETAKKRAVNFLEILNKATENNLKFLRDIKEEKENK